MVKNKLSNYDEIKLKIIICVTCEQTEPLGKKKVIKIELKIGIEI